MSHNQQVLDFRTHSVLFSNRWSHCFFWTASIITKKYISGLDNSSYRATPGLSAPNLTRDNHVVYVHKG